MDFIKSKPKETDKGNWISFNRINVMRLGITYNIDIELVTETYKIHLLTQETINTIKEIINSSKHRLIPPKEELQKYYNTKYNYIYVRHFYYDFDKEKYKIRLIEKYGSN